jgi:gas vesicle protein
MQVNKNGKTSGLITGLLLGGLLGSTIAILFAPMSGRKLRRRLSVVTDDLIDNVNEYVETGKEKADELLKVGKKKAGTILQDARKLVSL